MAKPSEIKSEIEKRVENGDVKKGDIIKVFGLNEEYLIHLEASFVGNRDWKIDKEIVINKNNPQEKIYDLYLKYVGGRK